MFTGNFGVFLEGSASPHPVTL